MQGSVAADSVHSHEHNLDPEYRAKLKNVDRARTHLNVTLLARDLKEVYEECFGDAVRTYNEKQTRKDRKIKDYYEKISASKQEHLAYEIIVQLGDKENNPAASLTDKQREAMTLVYKSYFEKFKEKWGSTLRVFEAVIHYDESTPHMHLAYVPVAHNTGKRGLSVKNSQRQAMQELGYYVGSKEERVDFYHDAQDLLTQVMLEHGFEREASRYDRADRGDMTQEEYIEFSENQEKLIESRELVEKELQNLATVSEALEETKANLITVSERFISLDTKAKSLEKEIDELERTRDDLKDEISDLTKEKGVLQKAVEALEKKLGSFIERIVPYLPNPLLALARIMRDGTNDEYHDWHDDMDYLAQTLSQELPAEPTQEGLAALADGALSSMNDTYEAYDHDAAREEWSIEEIQRS